MVIMIDDDEDTLEIYQLLLEKTEYTAHFRTFNKGLDALQFLDSCREAQTVFPKYILLDLNMPGIGGIEFIEKFESQYRSQYPETTIMILTSSVREKDNNAALSYASVTSLIDKPLSKNDLIAIIQQSVAN